MALVLADRVLETTAVTGTGNAALAGAQANYQAFSVIGDGSTTYYAIVDNTNNEWEVGIGTYESTGNYISRDTVLSSSNAGALVYFGSGTKDIFCDLPAEKVATLGALSYQGTWNASTNVPTLASGVGTQGYYYVVSVAGSTNLDGITDWKVNDYAIYNGTAWQKIDNTDAVTSVNGQTGIVVLTASDVGAQPAGTYVTSVGATSPVTSTGGTTPTIAMPAATTSVSGYLTSTDWNTFNGKAPATSGTSILYGNGTGGFSNVTVGSGLTFSAGTLAASGGAAGDVVGPSSATDNALVRFDTTTGKLIQNSVATLTDAGILSTDKELVGSNANFTDFPNAQAVFSQANTGSGHIYNMGIAGEGVATDVVGAGQWGVGVYGSGATAGATRGIGVVGDGHVGNTADTAAAIGVRGYSTNTHSGGQNIGLYSQATGGASNYSLFMASGNIYSAVAQTWAVPDNETSALSIDTTGKAGVLKIVTTDGAEKVTMSGGLDVTGTTTLATSLSGLAKLTSGVVSAATSGTDYAPATSGTSILYGNGSGGFSNVTIGTGVSFAGGTLSATGSGGTVTSVSGTAPIASSGGATPAISISQATTSTDGYLSSTDWNTFNNKQPAGSYLTAVTASTPLSGSGTVGSPLVISQATTSTDGYLSSTDWNTFNGKYSTGGALGTPSSGTLTNCTGYTYANLSGTVPTWNQDTTGKSAKTDALNSATTVVNVSSATAPTTGQVLTATGSTAATWQTPGGGFASGTRMSFQQTSAPTGWTKDTTAAINDSMLRLVTGTASSGGTTAFSTWSAVTSTGSYTLATANIPSHTHTIPTYFVNKFGTGDKITNTDQTTSANSTTSNATGGGGGHSHSLTGSLKYYDFIIASKD